MQLTQFAIDDGPHNSDGLLLHGWDGAQQVTAFISRRVMDEWVDPRRIVTSKYERGVAFNRQHPFVDVLLADITESGEALDVTQLAR